MILFLTSSAGDNYVRDGKNIPCKMYTENGFLDRLKARVIPDANCLIMASAPTEYEQNDKVVQGFVKSFELSDLPVNAVKICDNRNRQEANELVKWADFIILSGGHVPTENAFFTEINLAEILEDFDGVIVSISAGSMNCASEVYAVPELEGEYINPDYKRYLTGLGLTDINILPHLQYVSGVTVDGKNMVSEIAVEDSYTKAFYGLPDTSYFLIEENTTKLYGEAYYFENGNRTKICDAGQMKVIEK